jgi:acyl-[acyl-carrier-protein] desaturase
VKELLQRDPDGAVLAFAGMMQASIVMPAHLMEDGNVAGPSGAESATLDEIRETSFFKLFAALAESMGIYTVLDYAQIMSQLMTRWRIRELSVCFDYSGTASSDAFVLVAHCRLPT